MTILSLPTRPVPTQAPGASRDPAARIVAGLASQVDQLAELRDLIRRAQTAERQITQELLTAMEARGLRALPGHQAVAIRETRATLRVDPELFLLAAGDRAPQALTVSVTAARRLLGAVELEAISETLTTPVLRVEPLEETAA
jgi:hypothetical protein